MTKLEKKVEREVVLLLDNRTNGRRCDEWIVTMAPTGEGPVLMFRQKRRSGTLSIPLSAVLGRLLRGGL